MVIKGMKVSAISALALCTLALSSCGVVGGSEEKKAESFVTEYYEALTNDSDYNRLLEMVCRDSKAHTKYSNSYNNGNVRKNNPKFEVQKFYGVEKAEGDYHTVKYKLLKQDNNQYSNAKSIIDTSSSVKIDGKSICIK